jgi:hypothetical protein
MFPLCHDIEREAAVERNQQVKALCLAHLADHNARGAHAQRLLDQSAQGDLTGALEAGLTALHRSHVAQGDLQLEHLFAGDHPFTRGDCRRQAVEHRRLACLGPASHQDVQAGDHRGDQKPRGTAGKGPEAHKVLEMVSLDHEFADVDVPVVASPAGATPPRCRFVW